MTEEAKGTAEGDIVERLNSLYEAGMFEASPVIREAADEIERLRAALEEVADFGETDLAKVGRYAQYIARLALEGK